MIKQESHLRSLVKGISWRATGTLDTVLVATFVTHDFSTALKIGAVEVFTKVALYYGHERIWHKVKWGQPVADAQWQTEKPAQDSHLRSFVKGMTWRLTGTIDTMVISYFVTGNPLMALKIGAVEIFTKLALYYGHERIWQKIAWGQPKNSESQRPPLRAKATFAG